MKTALLLLLLCVGWAAASEMIAPSMPEEEVELMLRMGVDEYYLEQRGWIVEKIKDVISSITDEYREFREWIQREMGPWLDLARPHAEILKRMAIMYIKEMTKEGIESVIKAGYLFFRVVQSEIGEDIWQVIEALYRRYLEGKLEYAGVQMADFTMEDFDRYALAGCDTKYLLTEAFFWDSVQNVINSIKDWYSPFKNWISQQMRDMMDVMQPHVKTLQQMALVFVKEMTRSVIESVIKAGYLFFEERRNDLGVAVWELVEQTYRKYLEGKLQYLQ